VANAAEADALLPFSVVLPSNATATSLTVSQRSQALYGHFDSSTDGTYVLDEQPSTLTLAGLQEQDRQWHRDATHGAPVVVNGTQVLIETFNDGSVQAQWLRGEGTGEVLTWVEGPDTSQNQPGDQTFSQQQALAVASDIISQGG
jgi:hypothetical protein